MQTMAAHVETKSRKRCLPIRRRRLLGAIERAEENGSVQTQSAVIVSQASRIEHDANSEETSDEHDQPDSESKRARLPFGTQPSG